MTSLTLAKSEVYAEIPFPRLGRSVSQGHQSIPTVASNASSSISIGDACALRSQSTGVHSGCSSSSTGTSTGSGAGSGCGSG